MSDDRLISIGSSWFNFSAKYAGLCPCGRGRWPPDVVVTPGEGALIGKTYPLPFVGLLARAVLCDACGLRFRYSSPCLRRHAARCYIPPPIRRSVSVGGPCGSVIERRQSAAEAKSACVGPGPGSADGSAPNRPSAASVTALHKGCRAAPETIGTCAQGGDAHGSAHQEQPGFLDRLRVHRHSALEPWCCHRAILWAVLRAWGPATSRPLSASLLAGIGLIIVLKSLACGSGGDVGRIHLLAAGARSARRGGLRLLAQFARPRAYSRRRRDARGLSGARVPPGRGAR